MTPGEARLLRIYLDDHQTVLLAGRELVRRMAKPSPLGPLLELEGLRVVLDASRSLWLTLERTDSSTPDYTERADRAGRRLAQVEELRLVAADAALGRPDVD